MRLRVPGPTPVPARVLLAGANQVVYHRSPAFKALLTETASLLQPLFGTTGTPIVLSSSGTGGLEAALANTLREGDKVLVLNNGHWGQRFGRLATNLGANVETIDSPWGSGADVHALEQRLTAPDANDFVAILVAHNDTFTGAVSDLASIGSVVRDHPAVLIVDAVSSLGSMPIETDLWGLDIVVSASQKGLMSPPGLAMVAVSDKAWRRIESVNLRGEYWNLFTARRMSEKGETPFTPAVNVIFALNEALKMVHESGIAETFARQANLGEALAAGAAVLEMNRFPNPEVASPSVSVLRTPDNVDANQVVALMKAQFGTLIAGARHSSLDGSVIRIGTMGYCQPDDIRLDIYQLAHVLTKLGQQIDGPTALESTERILQVGHIS